MQRVTILSVICAVALGATGHHADAALIHYPWTWHRDAWFADAGALGGIETITFTEHPVALLNTQYQESHGLTVTGSGWVQIASSTLSFPIDGRGMRAVDSDAILHFDRPMQALAADMPGTLTAQLYYNDHYLGSVAFGDSGVDRFSGVISTTPFNRVRLFDSDHVFSIDDLHFVPVAVPGPATVALLLPAAWFMRRRRRRSRHRTTVRCLSARQVFPPAPALRGTSCCGRAGAGWLAPEASIHWRALHGDHRSARGVQGGASPHWRASDERDILNAQWPTQQRSRLMRSMHSGAVAVAMALFATTLINVAACAAISGYWHNDRDASFMDARADGASSGDLDVFAMADGGHVGVRHGAGDHPGGLDTVRAATGCEGSWLPGFGRPGMEPVVHAIVVFDDGSGPALYAGGDFTSAGGVAANRIAKWNGDSWSPVGTGFSSAVYALAVFDDGSGPALHAAGGFSAAGDVPMNRIAKWDGVSWVSLGNGVSGTVNAMTAFDDGSGPALYVGGRFTSASGQSASRIAKWDGASWSALGAGLGTGIGTELHALAVFDDGTGPALYAGGTFQTAGGAPASNIAKWDGAAWHPVGSGTNGAVHALAVMPDGGTAVLCAGGAFTLASGIPTNRIARWNGTAWSAIGSGMNATVYALAMAEGDGGPQLHAGGAFTTAGGVSAKSVATWNGVSWSAVGSGMDSQVRTLAAIEGGSGARLAAGGWFSIAGGVPAHALALWDGQAWSAVGSGQGMNAQAAVFAAFDDGSGPALYAGGQFTTAGECVARHIARWDGASWSPVGGGTDLPVGAMTVFDDGSGAALYVGGSFTKAGGIPVERIARWNGVSWSAVGSGLNGSVRALAVFDDGSGPALYAGGSFTMAGGVSALRMAKWDGVAWSPLLGGMNAPVNALAVFDDGSGPALFAGGNFTSVNGTTMYRIARWDGRSWLPVGGGILTGDVYALAVYDDGSGPVLCAGGSFTAFTGGPGNRIGRWNGSAWLGFGTGMGDTVYALAALNDVHGPSLWAGGAFTSAGGGGHKFRIARWDGTAWHAAGAGMNDVVSTLGTFDDGSGPALFASGLFTLADGVPAGQLAKWQACPAVRACPADLTADGTVGMGDLLVLLAAWGPCEGCDPDLDGDGEVAFSDVLLLLAAWGGCP